jgi:hypothetical protein
MCTQEPAMSIAPYSAPAASQRTCSGRRARFVALSALAVLGAVVVFTVPSPAEAQGSGKGFLFGAPAGSFSIRGGYALANAGSAVFTDAISQLTLDKRDFSSLTYGGDISYSPTPRTDLVFDVAYAFAKHPSEVRAFYEGDNEPIVQSTKFRRMPVTLGLRYYVADRGRAVSQFAYIPSTFAPYVGVAAGAMNYKFQQSGDFVDYRTIDPVTGEAEIVTLDVEDSGWTPMAHGMAGVDYSVGPWLALTFEGRYQWAKARLDPDVFEGYDKIDLTGFTGTVGFKVRF